MPGQTTEMSIACILHGYQMTHTQRVPGSLHLSVSHSMSRLFCPPSLVAHSSMLPVVQMCVYCYCRSICSTFTTADPSAVSLFSQNRITKIRTNNWVTLKCSRMRIPNSSELPEWLVCRSVSRQLVRHSINQGTTDTNPTRRKDESGKGVGRTEGTINKCQAFAFCICFAMWRI